MTFYDITLHYVTSFFPGTESHDLHVTGLEKKISQCQNKTSDRDEKVEVKEALFGKALALCPKCKNPDPRQLHVICEICLICFPTQEAFKQHRKAHNDKSIEVSNDSTSQTQAIGNISQV